MISLLLLIPLSAHAQVIDLKRAPGVFCEPSLQVSERTESCAANTNYLRAAKACMDKLDALENSLGSQAGMIAKGAAASQLGKTTGGANTYNFSSAALVYLRNVAGVAKGQVVDYKKYVAPPADENEDIEDPRQLMAQTPCFMDTEKALAKSEQEFADKIGRYGVRLAQAQVFEKTLKTSSSDFGSANAPVTGGGKAKAEAPRVVIPDRESDVSGTIEPQPAK